MELGTESCMQGEYTQVRSISNETQPMDHRSGLVSHLPRHTMGSGLSSLNLPKAYTMEYPR